MLGEIAKKNKSQMTPARPRLPELAGLFRWAEQPSAEPFHLKLLNTCHNCDLIASMSSQQVGRIWP